MEEILASIRRIISEDDPPADAPAAPAPVAAAPAAPAPEPEEDDVLELTQRYDDTPAVQRVGDIEAHPAEAPRAQPRPEPAYSALHEDEPLLSDTVAHSAASAFAGLAQTLLMPKEGRSLEDVVKELMRPLLREWLDRNLPAIVEAQVQAEVERIARRGGR